jgi:putative nucleotidyltransferase with HDIG domain
MGFSLDLREQICRQPIELPVFNSVALELLQLLTDHNVEIGEVVETINKDPSLSIEILKMANSPAYSGRYPSATIKDSVARLGAKRITNIAMAASQAAIHASSLPIVNEMMQRLWSHSYACAIGCHSLAVSTSNVGIADQAYMAGLLHDIGKLYLLKAMERIHLSGAIEFALDNDTLLDVFSDMHVEQGVRIMAHMEIPPLYRSIVAKHHAEDVDSGDKLLAIVRLVNFMSMQYGLDSYPRYVQPTSADYEIRFLQVSNRALEQLEADMKGLGR